MNMSATIIDRIRREQYISFRDFMDMALYFSGGGYYQKEKIRTGMSGDFYTAVQVSPAFGHTLAVSIKAMCQNMPCNTFTIVEYGAGNGELCRDILAALQPQIDLQQKLQYCIVEKNEWLREQQSSFLPQGVEWINDIEEISGFSGCVLSNELIDNLPVHAVVMQEKLIEIFVGHDAGFHEILLPAEAQLKRYMNEQALLLPEGCRMEINLDARDWLAHIAAHIHQEYIMTIDYGYSAEEICFEKRSTGTLMCYHQHKKSENYFVNIGEKDITAHVDFSSLQYWGKQVGLKNWLLQGQAEFLLAHGFKKILRDLLQADKSLNLVQAAWLESVITQTLLIDMGNRYKVLLQSKGNMKKA